MYWSVKEKFSKIETVSEKTGIRVFTIFIDHIVFHGSCFMLISRKVRVKEYLFGWVFIIFLLSLTAIDFSIFFKRKGIESLSQTKIF